MSAQPASETQKGQVPVKINVGGMETLFDRAQEIYRKVAQRAYELFEGRGRLQGFDLDDWLVAERELLHPVSLEVKEYDDHLAVRAEVPDFNEKEIQVTLEPHRLVINGKIEKQVEQKEAETLYTSQQLIEIFHTLELPNEVDPAKATATLKNGILDIQLPKTAQTEADRVDVKID